MRNRTMEGILIIAALLTAGLSAWGQAAYDPNNPDISTKAHE